MARWPEDTLRNGRDQHWESLLYVTTANRILTSACIQHKSTNKDGTAISVVVWATEGLAVCMAKVVLSFLSYFKTLTIIPNLEIEPVTFHPAVQHPTDLANSAKVKKVF